MQRRNFLKIGGLAIGGLAIPRGLLKAAQSFPSSERLGRVNVSRVRLKSAPDENSQTLDFLYEDTVVPWLREVVGPQPFRINQRWVETPNGFIWAPHLQSVGNKENQPVERIPTHGETVGMWVEVTVPWVDVYLENSPGRAPWLEYASVPRFYYSQVLWVDEVTVDDNGQAWYRINERYGSYGDMFIGRAEAFRPIPFDEVTPIHPEIFDKRVIVNLTNQTLSCFEGNREVYFCSVSTGAKFNVQGEATDTWETPPGPHPIHWKLFSLHMSGGASGVGWDLPGIGWTTFFASGGIAIHSTFWHNNFGVPMSHGCVNAAPDDAKWIFRWVDPPVEYEPGEKTIAMPGGTIVEVIEL
jgi:hypothetical protein